MFQKTFVYLNTIFVFIFSVSKHKSRQIKKRF
ncbi:hypothetical protein M104_4953, partial [Bacteroides fragilis str. 1007-1-F 